MPNAETGNALCKRFSKNGVGELRYDSKTRRTLIGRNNLSDETWLGLKTISGCKITAKGVKPKGKVQ